MVGLFEYLNETQIFILKRNTHKNAHNTYIQLAIAKLKHATQNVSFPAYKMFTLFLPQAAGVCATTERNHLKSPSCLEFQYIFF